MSTTIKDPTNSESGFMAAAKSLFRGVREAKQALEGDPQDVVSPGDPHEKKALYGARKTGLPVLYSSLAGAFASTLLGPGIALLGGLGILLYYGYKGCVEGARKYDENPNAYQSRLEAIAKHGALKAGKTGGPYIAQALLGAMGLGFLGKTIASLLVSAGAGIYGAVRELDDGAASRPAAKTTTQKRTEYKPAGQTEYKPAGQELVEFSPPPKPEMKEAVIPGTGEKTEQS